MNTRRVVNCSLLLLAGSFATSIADSWAPPKIYSVQSASKRFRFTVFPPELTNATALSSLYLEDYLLAKSLEGDITGKRLHCEGVLEYVSLRGKSELLWRRPLVNTVAPLEVMMSDTSNGVFIVTLDDWHAKGTSSNTVVVYNLNGKSICSKTLDDLVDKKEKESLTRSTSSIHWAGKHKFDESGKYLILQVGSGAPYREVRIELPSCKVDR